MAINTEQKALKVMKPDGSMTIQDIINHFINNSILTEEECKNKIKSSFPDVTNWSF